MTCDSNVKKGGERVLLAQNDAATAFEIIGGVETFAYNGETQTEGSTSSSTLGEFLENAATGFKDFGIELSGKSDKSTGVEPVTGLNIVGSQRLADIWKKVGSCALFMIMDVDTGGTIQGNFIVSAFNSDNPKTELNKFTATLTHKTGLVITGDI